MLGSSYSKTSLDTIKASLITISKLCLLRPSSLCCQFLLLPSLEDLTELVLPVTEDGESGGVGGGDAGGFGGGGGAPLPGPLLS